MRSALIVSVSPDFMIWLEALSRYPAFQECVPLNERLLEERYDLELVTRFCFLYNISQSMLRLTALRDLPSLLDDWSVQQAQSFPSLNGHVEVVFKSTFDFIACNGGESVFRRYDHMRQESRGSFLNTAFEIFALGTGYNIAKGNPLERWPASSRHRFGFYKWSLCRLMGPPW